jgi:hypothetical protein
VKGNWTPIHRIGYAVGIVADLDIVIEVAVADAAAASASAGSGSADASAAAPDCRLAYRQELENTLDPTCRHCSAVRERATVFVELLQTIRLD